MKEVLMQKCPHCGKLADATKWRVYYQWELITCQHCFQDFPRQDDRVVKIPLAICKDCGRKFYGWIAVPEHACLAQPHKEAS